MPEISMRGALPAFAQELLRAAGTDGQPPRVVGQGARLTGGGLGAYCPNKVALAQTLCRAAIEEFDRHANELSHLKEDPVAAIRALGMAYARFALERPARFQDIFHLDSGRTARELNNDPSRENSYLTLLQWVTDAVEQGLLRENDPELIAQTLWAGIHGVISLVNTWNDFPFKPQEMLISNMFEMLTVGVLADRPATGVSL
jgi:AcrR family transcriptional regulator